MAISSKQQYCYDYPRPAVTVDIVIVTRAPRPRVLLVRRKHDPFAGMWAVPGGFVEMDESLEDAAHRELKEETGIKAGRLRQLHTFGAPGRDPRGRTISVVYMAQLDARKLKPQADDDAAEVGWFSLSKPPTLAFDHAEILAAARSFLRQKLQRRRTGRKGS
ncbi:MAG TPA: NUDIX hydrolase [Gemmataceae bacterium]|nr:NUDIX hydrolase [Gemmataceae bacterium]